MKTEWRLSDPSEYSTVVSPQLWAVRRALVSTVIVQSLLQQRLASQDHRPRLACIDTDIDIDTIALSVMLWGQLYSQLTEIHHVLTAIRATQNIDNSLWSDPSVAVNTTKYTGWLLLFPCIPDWLNQFPKWH